MQETFAHPSLDDLYLYHAEMAPIDDIEKTEKHLLLCQQCRDAIDTIEKEHPEPGALDLFAIGRLTGPIGNGIKLHLAHCSWCSETLSARSEKVAQVRHGLNILIGQGAAAQPEFAETASKLGKPEPAKPSRAQKTKFDVMNLNEPPPASAPASPPEADKSDSPRGMSGFAFYTLGRKLAAIQTPATFQTLSEAYDALHELLDRKDLPLPAAAPAAQELSRGLREAMMAASEEGTPASSLHPDRLKTSLRRFENGLEDDLEHMGTLPLEPKATDELQSMVDHPEAVFPPQMWGALSPAAQHHWSDATRCLAYGLSTATAFHALRTLESVVNLYLERTGVPQKPDSLQDGLEMLKKQGANPKAVELALHLTSLHCNPLQRAECFVSAEEAVDQFDLCTIAIKAFLRDMERRQLFGRRPAPTSRVPPAVFPPPSAQPSSYPYR